MESTENSVSGAPARIVMLVDNGVHGDSRVQKTARAAADSGWDIILVGRSPNGEPQSWKLGAAEVRLVRMASPLRARRHEFRRHWMIAPFAYPPTGIAAHRQQAVKAWQADLTVRRALAKQRNASRLRQRSLRLQWAASKATQKWVSFRHWQLTASQRYRGNLRSPWDRAYTWFWHRVSGDRSWRRLEPQLWDYELAYGATIDQLKPDIIYANDFRMLGVGARAKMRAGARKRDVKLIWDVHEYLPGVKPRVDNARWMVANHAHEREYAPYVDAVITVSDQLAALLQRDYALAELPTVVLNTPSLAEMASAAAVSGTDIRTACGLDAHAPLVVYSGAAAAHRGLGVMVEAMPLLEHVHVAFVVNAPTGRYLTGLVARARELGVAERLHVLPYVSHDTVVAFLSTATAGVIPIHHWRNHEIQLITKFFEYSHARLPIVVSDVETMAAAVHDNGQGEVFRVDDVEDYARAVKAIVSDPQPYRDAYEKIDLTVWTWEAQTVNQDRIYRRLAPAGHGPTGTSALT
ncbi:MAG TPA: glycosyltransferase [Micromonosporaceae bacterium]|jgi:glycosyltransferase involved in cell wall biosynthesis|nr:glycosyltransferase [Micromonosporaceae bacterium]